jgi:phosphotransferase system  glucose/maltose/N-acetylglucosamine-specific IIC component
MNAIGISFALLAVGAAEVAAAPRFDQFPALRDTGQSTSVQLKGEKSRLYASRLRIASHQPINFAGHYVLATWGCGASCVMGAAIDAKTGAVIWVPFTVCCWPLGITEPLEYRPDSHLLVAHGSLDERGGGNEVHHYNFDGRRFIRILPSR